MPPHEPATSDNPFFHRGPVRNPAYFVGRQGELTQILALVRNAQSVSIVGPRRIGKTSLVFQLAARLRAAGTPVVHLTCEGHERATAEQLYARLSEELAEVAPVDEPLPGEPYRRLEALLRRLSPNAPAVVVIMDEFEILGSNPALGPGFFSALRGLAARFPLAFVTASPRPLIELTYSHPDILSSPFFNCFATLPLGLFSEGEAATLIRSLAAKGGLAWPEPILQGLLEWAGPHPLFLQVSGYHAVEAERAGHGGERLLAETARRAWPDMLPHFQYAWQSLSEPERYAVATIPAGQEPAVLLRLEAQCLVRRAGERHVYLSAAWRRFVRQQPVARVLQSESVVVDRVRRAVLVGERPAHLTRTQFEVLAYLMAHAGQPVSIRELESAVWQEEYVEDPERVKAVIKHLRKALGAAGRQIVNRRGLGYLYRSGVAGAG